MKKESELGKAGASVHKPKIFTNSSVEVQSSNTGFVPDSQLLLKEEKNSFFVVVVVSFSFFFFFPMPRY